MVSSNKGQIFKFVSTTYHATKEFQNLRKKRKFDNICQTFLHLVKLAKTKMAFCYRFKWRIPHPKEGNKVISFKLVVPFKSRKASNGRFGYSSLEGDHRLLAKALKFFKNRKYEKL